MIIVMSPRATQENVDRVMAKIEQAGLHIHPSRGEDRLIIGVIGDKKAISALEMNMMEGVEKTVRITEKYKLVSRDFHPANTIVDVAGFPVGGEQLAIMAGPCSVESYDQLYEIAVAVKAAGFDAAAHAGALQEQGGTIAVWGTGIDRVYPQSNKTLAHKIAESGLIISEFPLGTRPLAGNFPRRNRLIAAQSHAVLVVEAAVGSGSLITASQAAEMGREVMAVPGSIDNPHSKGCHHLIKNGAKLVECSDDILSECPALVPLSGSLKTKKADNKQPEKASAAKRRPQSAIHLPATAAKQPENPEADIPEQTPPVAVSSDDEHPLLRGMGYGAVHPDVLAESLSLPAADVYACLVEWELDGIVAAMPGGRYQRIR